jgi:phosphopentomutase
VRGYGDALMRLDARIPELLERLRSGDGLIFTADHGCDPTQPGTDHTREFVPYLEVGLQPGRDLGVIEGLGHVGERIESALSALPR